MKIKKRVCILFIVAVLFGLLGYSINKETMIDVSYKVNVQNEEFGLVKKRLVDTIRQERFRYYEMDLTEMPKEDSAGNLYLSSIDYERQVPSYWPAIRHLEYTMALAKSCSEQELDDDFELKNRILGLIDFWLENDFWNDANWYYNQIAIPYDLADISMIMADYLGEERIRKISTILDRGTVGRGVEDVNVENANGTDFIRISISNAVLTNDKELMITSSKTINDIVKLGEDKEIGIQTDMTEIGITGLYAGGAYPITFLTNVTWFASLLKETSFNIRQDKMYLVIDYVLDGKRFFHRNNGTPNFSLGRSSYQASGGGKLKDIVKDLISIDIGYRQEELVAYYKSFDDKSEITNEVKYFPVAGCLINLSEESYMAIKGFQSDMSMTDIQNEEGVLNYNFHYGNNTCYMDDGDEYSAISAVYDWSMIPGTTTYYESDSDLYMRYKNDYNKSWGNITHVKPQGKNCEGEFDNGLGAGVMVSSLINGDISGQNVFIIYDTRMFCLGNGFDALEEDNKNIITTIDQCKSDGILINSNSLRKGESVDNGSFRYTNLCENELFIHKSIQNGTISRTVLNYGDDSRPTEDEVFKCFFDWGTDMKDVYYAYEVSPIKHLSNISVVRVVNVPECSLVEFSDGMLIGNVNVDTYKYVLKGKELDLERGIVIKK